MASPAKAAALVSYLDSGIFLVIPPLVIAQAFASHYPPPFQPANFSHAIPAALLIAENVLRGLVFAVAALMPLSQPTTRRPLGASVYLLGLALYTASWALVCFAPASAWSRSLIGFTAPAWTPAVLLTGVALLTGRVRWLPWSRPWMYLVLCAAFLSLHITHTALAR